MNKKESAPDMTLIETSPLKEQAALELGRRALEAAKGRAQQTEAEVNLPKSA